MFKSWRNEKKKIKAVFKLEFQVTQVPRLKKPALIISLVPEDVGKSTFKLEKTAVQDGTCSWENPLYVTVKLVKEPKTGKLHEKIYHFIVSSGSSKSGYLGESSIDFADFAEENEPLTVSLPLKFANSGAVLHVTIQKVQGGPNERHTEENSHQTLYQDGSLENQMINGCTDGNTKNCAEEGNFHIFSVRDAEEDTSTNGSINYNASHQSILRQDSMPNGVDTSKRKNRLRQMSSTDWSMGSASDGSLVDSTNSPGDNLPREFQEASDESTGRLKEEISNLKRQSDLSELELQSLRKQIIKETRRAQDLTRQSIDLRDERDALKTECVQLKSSQKCFDEALNQLQIQNEDLRVQIEEVRRELSDEKELNTNLKVQIQKIQDSNSELMLAVKDLDEMLEEKNREILSLYDKLTSVDGLQEKRCKCNIKEDKDQEAQTEQMKLIQEKENASEINLLKQKIIDLCDEIESYRQDREKLEDYVEQLTQDYEDLKQENQEVYSKLEQNQVHELQAQNESSTSLATIKELELQVERLEEKLKKQTQEFSESLLSSNDLESQVKGLEKEMEKQAQNFENDLDAMMQAKIEQEQRAIHAEEALRKTRWKNALTAEKLQEEFKRLSADMSSRFGENEKQTAEALRESSELREEKRMLEESLEKTNIQLALIEEQNRLNVQELSMQLHLKTKEVEQMTTELEYRSEQLRSAQKHGENKQEAFSMEIQVLKAKIDKLLKEKNDVAKQEAHKVLGDETAQITILSAESKLQIEGWESEKSKLAGKLELAKEEVEKAHKELIMLRSSKVEKERMVENLLSDVESLQAQNIKLKHSLSKEESEKGNLLMQVFELTGELHKEKESSSIEKKEKRQAVNLDKNVVDRDINGVNCSATPKTAGNVKKSEERGNKKSNPNGKFTDEEVGVERKLKASTEQEQEVSIFRTQDDGNLIHLSTELAKLKERNKSMESELKEMQERYSDISLKFAEVEGERQQLVMKVRNLKSNKKN